MEVFVKPGIEFSTTVASCCDVVVPKCVRINKSAVGIASDNRPRVNKGIKFNKLFEANSWFVDPERDSNV